MALGIEPHRSKRPSLPVFRLEENLQDQSLQLPPQFLRDSNPLEDNREYITSNKNYDLVFRTTRHLLFLLFTNAYF